MQNLDHYLNEEVLQIINIELLRHHTIIGFESSAEADVMSEPSKKNISPLDNSLLDKTLRVVIMNLNKHYIKSYNHHSGFNIFACMLN